MGKVQVVSLGKPYSLKISTETHQWSSDEPADKGGSDEGPTAFELLLSSVGACIAITVQMYSHRKGWDLRRAQVELDHERVKAEDCPDCESDRGLVSIIQAELKLEGNLTSEQRERILEIGGRCPVKRAIEGEVKFRTRMAG